MQQCVRPASRSSYAECRQHWAACMQPEPERAEPSSLKAEPSSDEASTLGPADERADRGECRSPELSSSNG